MRAPIGPWAEWIASQLGAARYEVTIQASDFGPGANFVLEVHRAASGAWRTAGSGPRVVNVRMSNRGMRSRRPARGGFANRHMSTRRMHNSTPGAPASPTVT